MNSFMTHLHNLYVLQTPAPSPGQSVAQMIMMFGMIILIFYFFMIRPQQRRQKLHQSFLDGLKRGDTVVTSSGIIGKIQGVTDKVVTIDSGNGQRLRVLKSYISAYSDIEKAAETPETKEKERS